MKRIVISEGHGGSLLGRPRADGKPRQIALKKGRNEIEQEDLDVSLAEKKIAALFTAGVLHLEPVAAAEQPAIPVAKPKAPAQAAKK